MTDQTFPAPLVPAEVDLRDFAGMWLDTERLLRSDTWLLGTSDEKAAAMTLWCESWHQVPAASLPANDRALAKLSQAERWAKSKQHVLRSWVRCSDGRLYHPVVAEKALEAWVEKLAAAISGAAGNAKRWNVEVDTTVLRQQFRHAVDRLRALDPQSRVLKKRAVAVIVVGSQPESPPDGSGASRPDRSDRTGPDRTGPLSTSEGIPGAPPPAAGSDAGTGQAPPAPPPEDPPQRGAGNAYGLMARELMAGGLQRVSSGNPRFRGLVDAGATAEEFLAFADKARTAGDPFAYVVGAVEGERRRAAENPVPRAPAPKPGEPSGRLPEFKPEPPMTAEERARADEARKAAMARLGRAAA